LIGSGRIRWLYRRIGALDTGTSQSNFSARERDCRSARRHSYRENDVDMTVFCFAKRADAEQFHARFGGEFLGPKDRPKWQGSSQ